MNNYSAYIGSHEYILGANTFVRVGKSFIKGKVIEYCFPKHGIIGTYIIRCDDGKIRKAMTIYKEG